MADKQMPCGTRGKSSLRRWSVVSEEQLGRYSIFTLSRRLQRSADTGREHAFLCLEVPDWINIIAVTTDQQLILIEQYRPGTDRITLEIPGGAVDPGEEPLPAAARELEEETGYRAAELRLIGMVEPNPAFQDNRCWTYLAVGCTPGGTAEPDPSEEIQVRLESLADFTRLIDDGTIRHSLVIAAHDHLQRGLAQQAAWTELLAG